MDDQSPYASPAPLPGETEPIFEERVVSCPWGPWATLGWGLVIAAAWFAVQVMIGIAIVVVAAVQDPKQDFEALAARMETNGLVIAVATLLSTPVVLGVCALAAFLRGQPALAYLGVTSFRARDLWIGLGVLAVFIPLSDGLMYLTGRPIVPEFMIDAYQTAGFLPVLMVALILAAPIGEELFFRGFLYRGWAASHLGPFGATLITAGIWAAIHLQYDSFQMSHIFAAGLLFGWLRWLSGSAALTIVLHGVMNLVATIEAAIVVELL
jgi:membrane protease YdiL (CAAX protease family)